MAIAESTQTQAASVRVGLGARSYDILIGTGLLAETGALLRRHAPASRAAVVSDETVWDRHGEALLHALRAADFAAAPIVVPPGERSKGFAELERVCGRMLEAGIERGDVVIAFGGGVVGDLAGFAAGIIRRGVRFAQVPTTLLAQVDSSVGGKTGINTAQGKNLVGLFHQPSLVIADTALLDTLPARELRAGYAEVAKYGLLGDAALFDWLEDHVDALLGGDGTARVEAVRASCAAKAAIVAADEREAGRRALLNLGHTFAHALEAATGYSRRLLHGEAVAIGMCLAFELSAALSLCPPQTAARVAAHLARAGLPTHITDIAGELPGADGLIALMGQDKKVRNGRLTFILARGIGDAFITQDVAPELLHSFIQTRLKRP